LPNQVAQKYLTEQNAISQKLCENSTHIFPTIYTG